MRPFDPNDKTTYADRIRLSTATSLSDIIQWINKTVAYIVEGGDGFWVTKNFDINGHMYIEKVKSISKDFKHTINDKINLLELVMEYKNNVSYGALAFMPFSGKEPSEQLQTFFNIFAGYPVKYEPHLTVDLDILHPLFYHVRHVLANSNTAHFEYIVYWMAHIVQKPKDRTGVCMIFSSVKGTGKSTWWKWFGEKIIGNNQYLLFNDFCSFAPIYQEGKLFTIISGELQHRVLRKANKQLKLAFKSNTLRIVAKGIPAYNMPNYNNFVMLISHKSPVNINTSDSIYFKVNEEHDTEYFKQLIEHQKKPDVIKHFYHFLENLPLDNFSPQLALTALKQQ